MNTWVLENRAHYIDSGEERVVYFVRKLLGFNECSSNVEKAMRFKTKKEAQAYARQYVGSRFNAVKV